MRTQSGTTAPPLVDCMGQIKGGVKLSRPYLLEGLQTCNLRSGHCGLGLIRVCTLFPDRIHRGGDVKVSLAGLDRAVGVSGVDIQGIDFGVRSTCGHATIDVVTDDSGRRTWTPGECDAVLERRCAATRQRLLGGRVGSIAGERRTGRRRTTGLGREANREGHALAGRQSDRKSKTAHLKL